MKTPILAPPFHIQANIEATRNEFPYRDFHDSISSLWLDLWRPLCAKALYPFTDAKVEDFDPIFAKMVTTSGNNPEFLYQPDKYAQLFFPKVEELENEAEDTERRGERAKAHELYLRTAAVCRIARFPLNRSPFGQAAWERGKAIFLKGAGLLDPPVIPVDIPFSRYDKGTQDTNAPVQAYLRLPNGVAPDKGWPTLLLICGLDSYRTDSNTRTQKHAEHGFATICFEIPGTGDCPADPSDPRAPDRWMSSIFDWLDANAASLRLNLEQVFARGISTGGYYAIRAAHTHAHRLSAVVAQGGSCHHMFDAGWIAAQDQMDYPFALAEALAYKFGYRSENAVAAYAADGKKFSLLSAGILEHPCCKLLLIGGVEDTVFPIEDNLIVAMSGRNKDLALFGDRGHMGNPGAEQFVYAWLDETLLS